MDNEGNHHDVVAEGQETQADAIVDAAIKHVRALENFKNELVTHGGAPKEMLDHELFKEFLRTAYRADAEDVNQYLLERFTRTLSDAASTFKSWDNASTPASEGDKKESTSTEKLEEIKKESEKSEKKSEEKKESVKTPDMLKNEFMKAFDDVKGFFNGEKYVHVFREVQLIKDPAMRSFLTKLDEKTFYEKCLRPENSTKKYEDLEKHSDDSTVLTKDRVKQLYDSYVKAGSTNNKNEYLNTIPVLEQALSRLQAYAAPAASKWAQSMHKDAVIKSLNHSKISIDVFDKLLENFDDSDFFDEEQLATLTDDQKEEMVKGWKGAMRNQVNDQVSEEDERKLSTLNDHMKEFVGMFRSNNLIDLISAHPKAWSLQDRYFMQLGKKLIDSGVIELDDSIKSNAEISKLVTDIIDKELYTHNLSGINLELIEKRLPSLINK
ncbi:MAG: hypothetical protein Q4C49_00545 [Bacillota bacterium]|nr:hypothetical protein [Bacillota bacterium]